MVDFSSKNQCDRCGAKPTTGKLFRIPWTGDCLCKDCIDKDRSLQQLFAEISSMKHARHLCDPSPQADISDGMDMLAFILEPDGK